MLSIAPAGFRAHALDGAMLYFDPRSGTHVRVQTAATAHLRRTAPRVAMFGITNACNLRCAFCSRDATRPSTWTVPTAAAALQGLAAAGTLEVAYGGGEPLTFAGFDELVAEVGGTTSLAQHVTTNGTLITHQRWRALAGRIGMVRLSIYDDLRWRTAAAVLTTANQRWGANVLVDDAALGGLPAVLADLAARGAEDVSILTYVGEPARTLSAAGAQRLAALLVDAPLPARLSVCAGDRVPVSRLPTGLAPAGDCGAGLDFVSITPDGRVLACSFHDAPGAGHPGRTADEILAEWRTRRAELAAPSARSGCARLLRIVDADAAPPIAIWRAFSGNNSGDCVMVARFQTSEAAAAYLAELVPGWVPEEPISAAWQVLYEEARLPKPALNDDGDAYVSMPRELTAIGRSVIALGYDADDQFATLRGLAWVRDGDVAPDGVHLHGTLTVLAAIRARDVAHAHALRDAATPHRAWAHGRYVFIAAAMGQQSELAPIKAQLETLAAGAPLSVVILEEDECLDAKVVAVLQRLGVALRERPRVAIWFPGFDGATGAAAFSRSLRDQMHVRIGHSIVVEHVERPKRLAVLAARQGATTRVTLGDEVGVWARYWIGDETVWKAQKGGVPVTALQAALGATPLLTDVSVEPWGERATMVRARTRSPLEALRRMAEFATAASAHVTGSMHDVDELAWVFRRLITDVDA